MIKPLRKAIYPRDHWLGEVIRLHKAAKDLRRDLTKTDHGLGCPHLEDASAQMEDVIASLELAMREHQLENEAAE